VSAVSRLPVAGGQNTRGGDPFSIEGRPYRASGPVPQVAHSQSVGLDYFRTLKSPPDPAEFSRPPIISKPHESRS
jgi:hypothetical protein